MIAEPSIARQTARSSLQLMLGKFSFDAHDNEFHLNNYGSI
jgi:hypothetical protein